MNDTAMEDHDQNDKHPDQNAADQEAKKHECCPSVNRTLLPSKIFYFFYFSSWGSLIPYLALYFKEMLLSPSQVGILLGLRPFVNFIFNPLWGLLIDKFKKGKLVLLIALVASISTTFSLSLIDPAEDICNEKHKNYQSESKRAALNFSFLPSNQASNLSSAWSNLSTQSYKFYLTSVGSQPWPLVFLNLDVEDSASSVRTNNNRLFFHIFCTLLFGNIVAAPALTIVDTFTVKKLGDQSHKYGSQRLWGSLGFGVAAFVVGACVSITHYCPGNPFTDSSDINYALCFYAFAILMAFALITATKFDFKESSVQEKEETVNLKGSATFKDQLNSLKKVLDLNFLLLLYSAFFFGFLAAFIKTFLFWHLKDIGGTPELFCIIVAVHCVAEVTMYFLSARLITLLGHLTVLYLGFTCYFIRCFSYWLTSRPWFVLPIEVLSGVTSAAVWSAMLSYVGHKTSDGNATTMQGLLHGVHWGLGNGSGEMVGGLIVSFIGTGKSFLILGVASLFLLLAYLFFNNASSIITGIKTRLMSS